MARSRLLDPIAVNRFHLLDVSIGWPMVLLPVFGFRSVSFPTVSVTYREVKEGNYEYPRQAAVERVEVSSMTLEQGVQLLNSDFWDWTRKAIEGQVGPRNLLLIQFTNINSSVPGVSTGSLGLNLFEDGIRIPGKAWMLYRCRPIMYKPGSDLDALSGEISLASLEIKPEEIEEISLGV
jgi:phage tail-like protein